MISGHIGIAGRAALFLLVAILMYRSVSDDSLGSRDQNSFGNALSGLRVRPPALHYQPWGPRLCGPYTLLRETMMQTGQVPRIASPDLYSQSHSMWGSTNFLRGRKITPTFFARCKEPGRCGSDPSVHKHNH